MTFAQKLLWIAAVIVALRCLGHGMRVYRDRELRWLLEQTVTALGVHVPQAGTCTNITALSSDYKKHTESSSQEIEMMTLTGKFTAFLDWSSLLGIWRQNSFLYDEEDADLGVIVPKDYTAENVGSLLRKKFQELDPPWPRQVSVEVHDGLVYVVPEYNRLHVDLYLVSYDEDSAQVHPLWPAPTRTDSHAAAIFPRPMRGICNIGGFPSPANTVEYLTVLYGYIGSDARYNPETMLYESDTELSNEAVILLSEVGVNSVPAMLHQAWLKLMSETCATGLFMMVFLHLLARDVYFFMMMIPIHESTRRFVESRYESWLDNFVASICGEGRSFRDCFK